MKTPKFLFIVVALASITAACNESSIGSTRADTNKISAQLAALEKKIDALPAAQCPAVASGAEAAPQKKLLMESDGCLLYESDGTYTVEDERKDKGRQVQFTKCIAGKIWTFACINTQFNGRLGIVNPTKEDC